MNDRYIEKLRDLQELTSEIMCFKEAFESPNESITDVEGIERNILLLASDFAEAEITRLKDDHEIPEYRFGSLSERILKYLETGGIYTLATIMKATEIHGLNDAALAIDELLESEKIGKVIRTDGIPEFYLLNPWAT